MVTVCCHLQGPLPLAFLKAPACVWSHPAPLPALLCVQVHVPRAEDGTGLLSVAFCLLPLTRVLLLNLKHIGVGLSGLPVGSWNPHISTLPVLGSQVEVAMMWPCLVCMHVLGMRTQIFMCEWRQTLLWFPYPMSSALKKYWLLPTQGREKSQCPLDQNMKNTYFGRPQF